MSEPGKTLQGIEVHTPALHYSGNLTIPLSMRLSDFLNSDAHGFLSLQQVKATASGNGDLKNVSLLEEVLINKRNIVAVVLRVNAALGLSGHADRAPRVRQWVTTYAPPFVLNGYMHTVPNLQLVDTLDRRSPEFLPMTNVTGWWMESEARLGEGIEFVAVNRQWITAVHVQARSTEPAAASFWQPVRESSGTRRI